MKTRNSFKSIIVATDTESHELHIVNHDMMALTVRMKNSFTIDGDVQFMARGAFDELFAAHRIFGMEQMFQRGGTIKLNLNGHTFIDEGYDETNVKLSRDSIFEIVVLSTKGGFTVDTLYDFHDTIIEYFNSIDVMEL